MVETALTLVLFLTLVLGMLDLGLWVFRYHILAQTARQIARTAIVHGSYADRLGPWGPGSLSGDCAENPAGDPSDPATQLRQAASAGLIGLNPADVNFLVEWIDGGNSTQSGNHVRVSLTTTYQPIMTFIFNMSFTVTATSTMLIAH